MYHLAPKRIPAPTTQTVVFACNRVTDPTAVIFGSSRRIGVPSINSVPVVPVQPRVLAGVASELSGRHGP